MFRKNLDLDFIDLFTTFMEQLITSIISFQNRYTDVLCYDHTRVILRRDDNDPDSDYVNANYVDGYKQRNAFISMQVRMGLDIK